MKTVVIRNYPDFRPLLGWFAVLTAPLLTFAQTPPAAADDKPIELSPFEIVTTSDDTYIARNTLGASGMSIPVKDLPQSIEVITSEMIADLGAVQLDEVLRTSASYTPFEHDLAGIAAPTIRGFANTFTLRDGFRVRVGGSDTFNMDRVEIIKGAAAVLYGVSEPGGMVNYVVKKPQTRNFTNVSFTSGNYDFQRATLDVNQHFKGFGEGLAVRVLGVWQEAGDPIPWADNNQYFLSPKVTWRPFKNLRIDLSYEYNKREGFFAGRMPDYAAQVLQPDGTTATRNLLYPADTFDFAWDSQGPSAFSNREADTYIFGAELKVHRTTIIRANFQQNNTVSDQFYRGGTSSAPTGGSFSRYPGGVDPAPGAYRSLDGAYNHNASETRFIDYRIEALTQLDSPLGRHSFYYGWEQNRQDELFRAIVDPPSARVLSSTRPVFVDWLKYVTIDQLAEALRFPDGPTPYKVMAPRGLISNTGAAYLMTRHELFKNRVLLSLGARFDEDNNGRKLLGLDNLSYVSQNGLVFRVNENVSVYGLYNESFIPQSPQSHAGVLLPTIDGSFDIPPASGVTREVGVKADYGRLTFSAALFEVESGGRTLKLPRGTGGNNPEDYYTGLAGLDKTSGFEIALAASPLPGYEVTTNYVRQDARIIEDVAFPINNGKRLRSAPEESFAAQNRYAFKRGPLKGLALGFGVRYSSETQMELPDSTNRNDAKIRPSFVAWNGFGSYRFKAFDHEMTARLTVTNLLNDKYYLERNHLAPPRQWRLSLDTRF